MIKRPPPTAAAPSATVPARRPARIAACARSPRRTLVLPALAVLLLAACDPGATRDGDLDKAQLHAVLGELETMASRPDRAADALAPRHATPAHIDALFRMPALAEQPFEIRRQALALAGRGNTLSFDRPSDVLDKLASWFPDRFGTPQARKGRLGSAANRLYGPYPDWNAEAVAFMALWECMPQIAWEDPGANPFLQRRNDNSFAPLAAASSTQRDFGLCVHQLAGEPDHLDIRQSRDATRARAAAMGAAAMPVLTQKFDAYLHASGCSGKGPDDCVLLMWMWASLAPDDTRLAETLRWLEPAVRPTGEPPPLSRPAEDYGPGPQENNEARFDEAIRKAAFLRAKLNAVLLGPDNWPADARSATFLQLAQLQAWFDASVDARWQPLYALENQHDAINPWKALGRGTLDTAALLDELDALPADTDCGTKAGWFRHGGPALKAAHLLRQLHRDGRLICDGPDWAWLAGGETPVAIALRGEFVQALGEAHTGFAHEAIVSSLLGACTPAAQHSAWIVHSCTGRISQPMAIPSGQRLALLHKATARDWPVLALPPPPQHEHPGPSAYAEQAEWLQQLAQTHGPDAGPRAARLAADLEQRGSLIRDAGAWQAPNGTQSLVELTLWPPFAGLAIDGVALQSSRVLVLLDAGSLQTVAVPARFSYPQDDGRLAAITDLDDDGTPEVWLTASTPCTGPDCANGTLHMGEIHGDVLSYFKDNRPAPRPAHH